MLKYIKAELFMQFEECIYDVLLHGCNCFCDMDSGFARHVRLLYPNVYHADCETEKGNIDKLGTYSYANTEHGIIVNMYTQYHGGENFDINAFKNAMNIISKDYKNRKICMPKIGTGIGGGNWLDIEKILKDDFSYLDITVFDYTPRNNQLY